MKLSPTIVGQFLLTYALALRQYSLLNLRLEEITHMPKNTFLSSLTIIGLSIGLLSSCAQLNQRTKQDGAGESGEDFGHMVDVVDSTEFSEARLMVQGALNHPKSEMDDRRIAGSAPITSPLEYNRASYYLYGAEHLNLENPYFDFPVVYNPVVQRWIDYFTEGRGREFFARYSARSGRYAPIFGKILEERGLPRDMIFLAMAESGFQNKARSWARAVGPWQFMAFTGRRYGLTVDWYLDERRDPIKSTIAAANYLADLYEEFGSWELAAAGYNAGEGRIRRAIQRFGTDDFWEIRRHNHLARETREYVPKIMALAIIGKNLKTFGFTGIEFHQPLDFEEVEIGPMVDLMKLAEKLEIPFSDIQRYNPEIARWFSPPHRESYLLRVPPGKAQHFAQCCSNPEVMNQLIAKDFQNYSIRGQTATLRDVARRFSINDASVLALINGMTETQTLRRGQVVKLPFRMGQNPRQDRMYVDMYERPRRQVVAQRQYDQIINRGRLRGRMITNPTEFYTVQSGDSLWTVARRTGVDLNTIIASNLNILESRMIRPGDRLVIR